MKLCSLNIIRKPVLKEREREREREREQFTCMNNQANTPGRQTVSNWRTAFHAAMQLGKEAPCVEACEQDEEGKR